jgi:hypothetical protein
VEFGLVVHDEERGPAFVLFRGEGLISVDTRTLTKWVEWMLWRAAVDTVMELFKQRAGYLLGL